MGSENANLYASFKPISLAEWKAKIEKDLKGKPLDTLHFRPEFDLDIKAYYHPEEFVDQAYSKGANLNNDNNDWSVTNAYVDTDSKTTNSAILKALNEGVSGIKITLTSNSNLEVLFSDVLIEYLFTHVVCKTLSDCERLIAYLKAINKNCIHHRNAFFNVWT